MFGCNWTLTPTKTYANGYFSAMDGDAKDVVADRTSKYIIFASAAVQGMIRSRIW